MKRTIVPRLPQGRVQLVQVLAASGDVIHISDVAKVLSISRVEAAKRLARWREQGWLSRVGSGAYVAASIDTLGAERVLDDAWVLVPELFAPAYIAGRTAAEHWDRFVRSNCIRCPGEGVRDSITGWRGSVRARCAAGFQPGR
jgi:Transcriptional regulator, AbiEi antitoxin